MSLGVSFETYLRRLGDVLMGRPYSVLLRRRHDVPIKLCREVPLKRLGDGLCWVFHLRRTCDVAGTSREMPLRRRYDVLLPVGF